MATKEKADEKSDWFIGPSSKKTYIPVGSIPNYQAASNTAEDSNEEPPPGYSWRAIDLSGMAIRTASNMPVVSWARMGMWRKKPFSLLLALAIRLPKHLKLHAWVTEDKNPGTGHSCYVTLRVQSSGSKSYAVLGSGTSKNKAKNAAAEAVMKEASLLSWLEEHHADTMCADYL